MKINGPQRIAITSKIFNKYAKAGDKGLCIELENNIGEIVSDVEELLTYAYNGDKESIKSFNSK